MMLRGWWVVAGLMMGATAAAWAGEPRVKWTYTAESNLYAPPLVTDLDPRPGLESVISDSELRRLRCVDAQGNLLWDYDGHWKKRLTSAASLSRTARAGQASLLIGNGDGTLDCVDAATGKGIWKKAVGSIEWGAAIWTDLDGDGKDEAVAGTENNGIVALTGEGEPLWTYQTTPPMHIQCPIGAADLDGDGKAELFAAVNALGLVCVNGDGQLRWSTATGDDFFSTVVIADADRDGRPELYCSSLNDDATFCFDALTGAVKWKTPMLAGADAYPSSSIAVGDVDGDGQEEIVVSDRLGDVYCLNAGGEPQWMFQTEKRTHAAPTLGDVDGDGAIETLLACGDHYLYCLSNEGVLKWRFAANLRLMYPATIADVDNDGKTDILFGGADHMLRCLTLDGRYQPELVPWPSRRFDGAQTGNVFGKRLQSDRKTMSAVEDLLANGGFELEKPALKPEEYPAGWKRPEPGGPPPRNWSVERPVGALCSLDAAQVHSGARALKVVPQAEDVIVVSGDAAITPEVKLVDAEVWVYGGANASAAIRWKGNLGLVREDALTVDDAVDGWRRLHVENLPPPRGARWAVLALTSPSQAEPIWWDEALLSGHVERARTLRALVNQVGYEAGMPKCFTAQINFPSDTATFELIGEDGASAFRGALQSCGRIQGAYGQDWGYNYWRGDFTGFDAPGRYRIKISAGDLTDISWPFAIGPNVLWDQTSRPGYRFFYYQRCGCEIPGYHKACHLDDATNAAHTKQYDLAGGWHDAGDYNKYHNAPYVVGLARAYGIEPALFDQQDEDRNGVSDFWDEILWGGDHVRRMIQPDGSVPGPITSGYGYWGPPDLETDNLPLTGDERPIEGVESGGDPGVHLAAVAKIARYARDKAPYLEAANRALAWCREKQQNPQAQFAAAVDLYLATGEAQYAQLAKELFPTVGLNDLEAAEAYDAAFKEDHREQLRARLTARAEEVLALAANPFGVYTYGTKEKPNFFGTPDSGAGWHIGTDSHLLEGATAAAQAYRYNPDPRYLAFIYDQFNWILGSNPFDLCLMEGQGSANPPTYHQRLTFAGVPRGAIPGSIVNGITWRAIGDDSPYFDLRGLDIADFESNEVWLPHNTNYMNALANLQAIHRKGR